MTNEELKEKILAIVRGAMVEADELPFMETTDNIADALIEAGIGDVKKLQFDNEVLKMRNFFLEGAERSTEEDRQVWISKWEEAEHRAGVAERALHCLARSFAEAMCKDGDDTHYLVDGFIQDAYSQAEKELAEVEKDD